MDWAAFRANFPVVNQWAFFDHAAVAPLPTPAVRALADAYWEGVLRRNPTLATFYGDDRYDDRLPDVGPSGRALEQAELSALVAELDRLDPASLEVDDRITVDMLRLSATAGLDALRFRLDELAVDQMEGPQVWLPELLNWQPLETPEQVDRLVARYRAFPAYLDDYQQNLQDCSRDGRTAPRIAVERVAAQLQALLATRPEESALAAPEAPLGDEQRRALVTAISPSYPSAPQSEPGSDPFFVSENLPWPPPAPSPKSSAPPSTPSSPRTSSRRSITPSRSTPIPPSASST